jgi:uncharacterized protein YeaO (DUF488 family)
MLYRASVNDVKSGRISRRYGYLVVVMQFYPRFLGKELIDEYLHDLAPDRELFGEFKALDRASGDHEGAFAKVRYEERFTISGAGLHDLERLSALSAEREVYLLCQCASLEHCHADLLLLTARRKFGAKIPLMRVKYPRFEERLEAGEI